MSSEINNQAPTQEEVDAAAHLLVLLGVAETGNYLPEDGLLADIYGQRLLVDEQIIRQKAGDILARKTMYGMRDDPRNTSEPVR